MQESRPILKLRPPENVEVFSKRLNENSEAFQGVKIRLALFGGVKRRRRIKNAVLKDLTGDPEKWELKCSLGTKVESV